MPGSHTGGRLRAVRGSLSRSLLSLQMSKLPRSLVGSARPACDVLPLGLQAGCLSPEPFAVRKEKKCLTFTARLFGSLVRKPSASDALPRSCDEVGGPGCFRLPSRGLCAPHPLYQAAPACPGRSCYLLPHHGIAALADQSQPPRPYPSPNQLPSPQS